MYNEISDKRKGLSTVSYEKFFEKIGEKIPDLQIVYGNGNFLFSQNLESICYQITRELGPQFNNDFISQMKMAEDLVHNNFVTLNFKDKEKEHQSIFKVYNLFQEKLSETFRSYNLTTLPTNKLEDFVFDEKKKRYIVRPPFSVRLSNKEKNIEIGKLAYNEFENSGQRKLIRHDDVKIKYSEAGMLENIKQSLIHHFNENDEMDTFFKEQVIEQIKSEGVFAEEIYRFIQTNSFAAIKRTSSFLYLEYIIDNVNSAFAEKYKEEIFWMRNYISRFERLEETYVEFLREARYPKTEIFGKDRDILNELRHKNRLDFLPFLGKISSSAMAKTNFDGKELMQYGISMKLNGKVRSGDSTKGKNESSYDYHRKELSDLMELRNEFVDNPINDNWSILEKYFKSSLRVMLFKYFLFNLDQGDYDPTAELRKDLDKLKGYDAGTHKGGVIKWYKQFADTFFSNIEYTDPQKISYRLHRMKKMLIEALDQDLKDVKKYKKKKQYKRRMTFLKSVLSDKLFSSDRMTVFKEELDTHNYKYTILAKEPMDNSLFSFEYGITFHSNFLLSEANEQSVKLKNLVDPEDEAVKVMFLPRNQNYPEAVMNYTKSGEGREIKKVMIPYPEIKSLFKEESVDWFIFMITYKLIVYLFLHAYIETIQLRNKKHQSNDKKLSVFFWQLFENVSVKNGKKDHFTPMENQIRQFRKELAFLFADKCVTGTQGFNFGELNNYKYQNSLSSVYNNVPKEFVLKEPIKIGKIAIIALTSFKTDTSNDKQNTQYKTGIFGEIYTVESERCRSVLGKKRTFFDHSDETIYQKSYVLETVVQDLSKEGYQHILYIAKTPYTEIFLEKKDHQKEMYFMSQDLVESMHQNHRLSIYPLHYNQTSAFEVRKKIKKAGMYVDDTSHIQKNLFDGHSGIVPVFQVYSGSSLNYENNIYNTLGTYQTLSKVYDDEILNNKIQTGLIDPDGIKNDFIKALLLLHSSKNEANKKEVIIKIDPYKKLFGDEGVTKGALQSVKFGKNKRIRFNILALMGYIRNKVLDQKDGELIE